MGLTRMNSIKNSCKKRKLMQTASIRHELMLRVQISLLNYRLNVIGSQVETEICFSQRETWNNILKVTAIDGPLNNLNTIINADDKISDHLHIQNIHCL